MAEAVVSTALETLRDLLVDEARFLYGVSDEVKELEIQLKEMKCLLKDADRRRHESETILTWISEIKDLVYRAEAAIERHAAHQVTSRRRRGLRQLVRKCSCSLEKYKSIHQLGSEISPIKSRLERINKEMLESGIKKSIINNTDEGESSSANNRARMTFPESGKTTIAKKLYNETNTSFDLCAWVCISQQCQSFQSVWNDVLTQLQHQNRKDGPKIRKDVTSLSEWEEEDALELLKKKAFPHTNIPEFALIYYLASYVYNPRRSLFGEQCFWPHESFAKYQGG